MLARFLLAIGCALGAAGAYGAPFKPASDSEVVERLPTGDPAVRRADAMRRQLASRPDDVGLRLDIARRYFDLAMAQGDPRFVGYSAALVAPLEKTAGDNARYWLVRGLVQQYNHDFADALRSLEKASDLDPQLADAIAWRAAISMVQARYPQALANCTRLVPLAHPLQAHTCTAYVHGSTGQLQPAYEALAREAAEVKDLPPELTLWVHTRLAEMAVRLRRPDEAQRHFQAALQPGIADQFLLASYADFLVQQKRATDALALLSGWERSDALLLRLALAGREARDPRAVAWTAQLRERFEAAERRGDRLHEQEAARFQLDIEGNAARALELARRNYEVQKEPRDAEILMRAALAAGQPKAAQAALDWRRANGYEDAVLADLAQQLASRGAKP